MKKKFQIWGSWYKKNSEIGWNNIFWHWSVLDPGFLVLGPRSWVNIQISKVWNKKQNCTLLTLPVFIISHFFSFICSVRFRLFFFYFILTFDFGLIFPVFVLVWSWFIYFFPSAALTLSRVQKNMDLDKIKTRTLLISIDNIEFDCCSTKKNTKNVYCSDIFVFLFLFPYPIGFP